MDHLKPNAQRAKNAVVLIWIVLAFEIISLISKFFQYDLLQTALSGEQISMDEATANDLREQTIAILSILVYIISGILFIMTTANDLREQTIAILSILVYIISGILFIMWFRRAYYNLHRRATILSYTEGWAAGSWFVPIIHLYRPYQIMKELHEETQEILNKHGINVDEKFNMVYLGWWWSLWIINTIMGQFVFRYTRSAEGVEELSNSTVFGIVENCIGIPLALITIKIITNYASVEPLFYHLDNEKEITNTQLPDGEDLQYIPIELN